MARVGRETEEGKCFTVLNAEPGQMSCKRETTRKKHRHGDAMNARIFTALARLSRLLVALLTLPLFLAVALAFTLVMLGTWIMDGE